MQSGNPLVSVVMPVYNGAAFLQETLVSVFSQTFKDYEILCVDDGSTDNSLAIITDVSSEYGGKVRVHRQHRAGQSVARNTGARHATGRYLAFLDQDDVWYPHKLERQVSVCESSSQVVLVHCNYDEIDEAGRVLRRDAAIAELRNSNEDWEAQLLGKQPWILPSVMMVRRKEFEFVGGFDSELFFGEEALLCLRMRDQGQFVFLEETLSAYRQHAAGRSKRRESDEERLDAGVRFYRKLELRYANEPEKLRLVRLLLASRYSDYGWYKVRTGHRLQGLHLMSRALTYDPSRFRTYSRLLRSLLPRKLSRLLSKRR